MVRLEHVADSNPPPVYTYFRHAGVHFTRTVFQPGQWQTMRFPQDVHFADLASCHIQPRGTFVDAGGVLPDRNPGWISREDPTLVRAGEYRRQAKDVVEVWCARSRAREGTTEHVECLRLHPGETVKVKVGDHLLLISGRLTVAGRALVAVQYVEVTQKARTLKAAELSYCFRWREVSRD